MSHFQKLDTDVLAFSIDRCGKLWVVLAQILKVEDEDSLDASCDELVLRIVPMQEVDCAKVRSWVNSHDIEVLVQKDELKV